MNTAQLQPCQRRLELALLVSTAQFLQHLQLLPLTLKAVSVQSATTVLQALDSLSRVLLATPVPV